MGAAASATAATQNTTIIPRTHTAPAAEKPTPVTTVSQAARHSGHFGSNTSTAPGRLEAAALESRGHSLSSLAALPEGRVTTRQIHAQCRAVPAAAELGHHLHQ